MQARPRSRNSKKYKSSSVEQALTHEKKKSVPQRSQRSQEVQRVLCVPCDLCGKDFLIVLELTRKLTFSSLSPQALRIRETRAEN